MQQARPYAACPAIIARRAPEVTEIMLVVRARPGRGIYRAGRARNGRPAAPP